MATVTGTSGNDFIHVAGDGLTPPDGSYLDNPGATDGNDTINFAAATDLSSNDYVTGGLGFDILTFTTNGSIPASAFAHVSHIEQIVLANGTNTVTLSDALVGSADDGHLITIFGSGGDDFIDASAVTTTANHLTISSGTGHDILIGGAGADTFVFGRDELNLDSIDGGTGAATDRLVFRDTGSDNHVDSTTLGGVSHIEQIVLSNDTNFVTLSDFVVGSADDAHLLSIIGGSGSDTIDASAVTTVANRVSFTSGAGDDRLTGGAGADVFNTSVADLNSDSVNGGTGASLDSLAFSTAGTVGTSALANVRHIEQIILANGTNGVTISDALVSSADDGQLLSVIGGTGNDFIDASAVITDTNKVSFASGAGNDVLTGGASADVFNFAAVNLTSADAVNGGFGASLDRLTFTTAGTVSVGAFNNVVNIEQIVLTNGTNNITLSDAVVGSADDDSLLTIFGSSGNGNDTVNAAAVITAANHLTISSGGGNDTLTGGAGADTFMFAATELTSGDTVNGGTGVSLDRLSFSTAGTFAAGALNNVSHIEQIVLANGTNNIALSNAMVGSADDAQLLTVIGGTGNDTIDGSAVTTATNKVAFSSGSGNDVLTGGAGADIFNFTAADLTSADTVNGGAGASLDRLTFTTAGAGTAGAFANVSHVEQIVLTNGTNTVTLTDAMVGSADDGHLVTIFASSGNGNDTINAAAVTTAANHVTISSGAGNDTLTGGAGADSFMGGAGADLLTGNGGADRFVYTASSESSSTNYDTLVGVDFGVDKFDIVGSVNAIDAAVTSGTLSTASFDANLSTAMSGHLNSHDAILFTANAGTLSGQTFLVVDINGTAGYQANADLVFHLTGQTGTLATTTFV